MSELDHIWQYIDGNKFKMDIIDDDGFVWGHINNYKSKERAKRVAERIRETWPTIKFKLIKAPKSIDLYGDYYKFYDVITKEQLLALKEIKERRGKGSHGNPTKMS